MNKYKVLLSSTMMILLAVLFTGCPKEVETVTPTERMTMFRDDVNAGNWLSIKGHTHPDADKYTEAGIDTFWSNEFIGQDFTFTVSGNTATGTDHTVGYTFTLQEDDKEVYKIRTITRTSGGSPNIFY